MINRDDYTSGKIDHQTFYCAVADAIGRQFVESVVTHVASIGQIREALKTDKHLNNISLWRWDAQDGYLRSHITHNVMAVSQSAKSPLTSNKIAWSLSDTVCTLKAAARRMAEESSKDHPDRPICPNCGQWVNPGVGNMPDDCMHECHKRGFA